MSGLVNSPDGGETISGAGVSVEHEGLILQRGGEELALVKQRDRFTVRLVAGRSAQSLTEQIHPQSVHSIPSVQLVEFQVNSEQLDQAMAIARASDDVEFASHVYQIQNSPNTLVYLTDQLTIQFADTVNRATIGTEIAALGLKAVKAVLGVAQTFVFRVTDQAAVNPIKLANQLMRRSDVLTAEPNIAIENQAHYHPRDPDYPKQWYLHHAGGRNLALGSHISVEGAWEITRGDRSIVVAIADDGFDLNHPDFQGKGKIAFPKDFQDNGFLPLPDASQENHGTACAGVAIAEENQKGIVGVAPGCTFMPVRTTGYLDDTTIETLFNYLIDKGAAVVSCSWGPAAVYFPLSLRQRAVLTRAATEGRNGKGCVIVFAAGNANRPISGSVNEQGWDQNMIKGPTNWLNGFVLHPDVIVVSACTSLNKKSAYSNWGTTISVVAPSNNGAPGMWLPEKGFVATGPTIRSNLVGEGIFTSDRLGSAGYSPGDFTADFGGTSSACPVVVGVAALVLSANPNLTAREVKQILQDTADKIVDPDPDPQLGLRRGTYDAKGYSQWFGYGKINALKAVQAAQQRLTPIPRVSRYVQQQNTTPINIPDDSPQGITSSIQITEAKPILDIQVSVDIEHSFLGDLEVRLIPPRGQSILLQSRNLGRLTRLQTTYSLETTPLFRQVLKQSTAGRWQLQMVDYAPMNTGRLVSWQISLGI
jgi:subtilisin family serine protease